jgi:hypothetical protein
MKTAHRLKTPRPQKRPKGLRRLLCAIIVDEMGTQCGGGPEQEIRELKKTFSKEVFLNPITYYRALYAREGGQGIKPGTDLVLFDYGGMSLGNDLLGSNSRELIKWLQDHPNSLAIIVSAFTYQNGIEPELREMGFQTDAGLRWDGLTTGEAGKRPLFHNLVNWYERYSLIHEGQKRCYTTIPEWFDAELREFEKGEERKLKEGQ